MGLHRVCAVQYDRKLGAAGNGGVCGRIWGHPHVLFRDAVRGSLSVEKDAAMPSLNITLPDPLQQFVDSELALGRYGSVSDYICGLIRADEKRKMREKLEALLLEGLHGEDEPLTDQDWSNVRQQAFGRPEREVSTGT